MRVPGEVSVPVRVMVGGNVYRTIWTRWTVEIWSTHSVLTRAVKSGQVLTASMFKSQRLALDPMNVRGSVLGEGLIAGSIAARDLEPGIVLTEGDVRRPTLVKAGDTVFFEINKGAITARVSGVAEADGARGDRITVTLIPSERQIKGLVAARGLVRMTMSSEQ